MSRAARNDVSAAELSDDIRGAYTGKAIGPLRHRVSDVSLQAAYAVQDATTEAWLSEGRRIAGFKIGLTAPSIQEQLGITQPDFGVLWADAAYADGQLIEHARFLQPRVEAEVAFVVKDELAKPDLTASELIAAVDFALVAIEVVDSRIVDWDISLFDTVADNASFGAFVVGTRPVPLSALDLASCSMQMTSDDEVVSSGKGRDCLGGPLNSALWLAREMASRGRPIRKGQLILAGALGPMVAAGPGAVFEASIDGLGKVRAVFSERCR